MSFSLPVRLATEPSLTLDPVFSLLYEDNEASLTHFINNKAPLPLSGVISDPAVMDYLLTNEPGPKVEYKNIRPALTALRPFLSTSPNGKKLMAFYRQLLQLQGRWAIAAAEMVAFDVYVKFYQALFIDRSDKKLVDHVIEIVPDAAYNIATYSAGTREQFNMMIKAEKERLVKNTRATAANLFDFKASKEFFQQHGKLVAAIELSEKKLKAAREKMIRRKREAAERRAAIVTASHERNTATLERQMGMNGMTPHFPHLENWVIDWANEFTNECFPSQEMSAPA